MSTCMHKAPKNPVSGDEHTLCGSSNDSAAVAEQRCSLAVPLPGTCKAGPIRKRQVLLQSRLERPGVSWGRW